MCIPIIFGCPDKIKPESGDDSVRVCPNCHNAAVHAAKSTTWFELFWIPLIPFSSDHIWLCATCNWRGAHAAGQPEPPIAGSQPAGNTQYQPTYINPPGAAVPPSTYQPQYALLLSGTTPASPRTLRLDPIGQDMQAVGSQPLRVGFLPSFPTRLSITELLLRCPFYFISLKPILLLILSLLIYSDTVM
ncbi:hypothetical protein MIND_01345700 [Mycena indigotica]|uniref:Zinc-ribbon 15 domain-containing protein n=1 Tax=Mycena indigotica TaxID=2126181 RepID=A0A8H6RZC1_9AGAR|nr:uncharacterized protein MIND_01345700 [Mycena indigotica]KAF7289723.1 hypothetical protein MIND_01345700 [Mycena indigotica]